MDCILITQEEYKELLRDALLYRALEQGGVDNWEWCGDSIHDFLNAMNATRIEELVDKKIQGMELITIGEEDSNGL